MDIEGMTERFITADGVRLHVVRCGSGVPVVCSHGVTDSGMNWITVARRLMDRYEVIMWDQRGHGDSDAPDGQVYDRNYRANDLAGLIHSLDLDRPFLMGHSMGGDTSAMYASLYPDTCRGLVLEDPSVFIQMRSAEDSGDRAQEMRSEIERRRGCTLEELIEEGRTKVHPGWAEEEYEYWAEAKLKVSPRIVNPPAHQREPWQDVVSRIRCPVLLIGGDPDVGGVIVNQKLAAEASEIWKQNGVDHQVSFVPGAGHNIRRDQFDAFLAVVEPWLDSHI